MQSRHERRSLVTLGFVAAAGCATVARAPTEDVEAPKHFASRVATAATDAGTDDAADLDARSATSNEDDARPPAVTTQRTTDAAGSRLPACKDLTAACARVTTRRTQGKNDPDDQWLVEVTIRNACRTPVYCRYRIAGSDGAWSTLLAPNATEKNEGYVLSKTRSWEVVCVKPSGDPNYPAPEDCDVGYPKRP